MAQTDFMLFGDTRCVFSPFNGNIGISVFSKNNKFIFNQSLTLNACELILYQMKEIESAEAPAKRTVFIKPYQPDQNGPKKDPVEITFQKLESGLFMMTIHRNGDTFAYSFKLPASIYTEQGLTPYVSSLLNFRSLMRWLSTSNILRIVTATSNTAKVSKSGRSSFSRNIPDRSARPSERKQSSQDFSDVD